MGHRVSTTRVWPVLVFACALGVATGPGVSRAQSWSDQPVELTADQLEYEAERELFVAQGNVRIVSGDRSIEADWVVVARGTEQGIASGHVVYRDGPEELFSEFLQFDAASLQGLIYQARLDTGDDGFLVDADQLIRRGDQEYTIRGGTFTTCRCPKGEAEPWRIDAEEANVEIGGYATAQNTTLDILGVPVVWLPWVIFPVKTERESGVLFPEFGFQGDAGFEVGLPLFWAARKNINVTATPVYMTKRGYKQNLELEYLAGRKSKGRLFAAYGHDVKRADANVGEANRWTTLFDHDQWLPGGWRAKADVHLVSDNEYVEDYTELAQFRDDLFLDSTVFAFNQFGADGRVGVVGSAVYTNDLQTRDDSLDRDAIVHQRLPSLQAEVLAGSVGGVDGLVTRFEFGYEHFYSDRLPQDKFDGEDPIGDDLFLDIGVDARPGGLEAGEADPLTIFNEGEPLADRGQRFILHPRVAYPLRLFDRFELYPEVGYRETLYTTEAQDFAEQGHITARVDLRTRLIGNAGSAARRHVIEPYLGWAMVSRASSAGDPLFVPATAQPQHRLRQLERDNLLADPSDRVNQQHIFTVGVSNRLYSRSRMLGTINLSIDYHDVGKGTRYSVTQNDENFSRFVVAGESRRLYDTITSFDLTFDPDRERVEEGLFSLTWLTTRWLTLHAGYRYRAPTPARQARYFSQIEDDPWDEKTQALSQVRPGGTLHLGEYLLLRYNANYDLEDTRLLRQQGTIEYRSKCKCWAVGLDIQEQKSGELRFQLRYSLLGSGDDRLRTNAFASSRSVARY